MSSISQTREEHGLLPYRKWWPDDQAELMRMVEAGVPRQQIADHFGVGRPAIAAMIGRIRTGKPRPPRNSAPESAA